MRHKRVEERRPDIQAGADGPYEGSGGTVSTGVRQGRQKLRAEFESCAPRRIATIPIDSKCGNGSQQQRRLRYPRRNR